MMYICSQCGNQIPDDAEFCYYCGCLKSKALKMDDSGHIETGVCHVCGEPVKGGESFCTKCGAALVLERPMMPVKMDGRRIAALILATMENSWTAITTERLTFYNGGAGNAVTVYL